jgi:hypothetical protein
MALGISVSRVRAERLQEEDAQSRTVVALHCSVLSAHSNACSRPRCLTTQKTLTPNQDKYQLGRFGASVVKVQLKESPRTGQGLYLLYCCQSSQCGDRPWCVHLFVVISFLRHRSYRIRIESNESFGSDRLSLVRSVAQTNRQVKHQSTSQLAVAQEQTKTRSDNTPFQKTQHSPWIP